MEDTFVELLSELCEWSEATELQPLHLGNVKFWSVRGALVYSPSNSEWDRESLVKDLTNRLKMLRGQK